MKYLWDTNTAVYYLQQTATEKDSVVLSNFINDALVIELEQTIKFKTAEIRKARHIKCLMP